MSKTKLELACNAIIHLRDLAAADLRFGHGPHLAIAVRRVKLVKQRRRDRRHLSVRLLQRVARPEPGENFVIARATIS